MSKQFKKKEKETDVTSMTSSLGTALNSMLSNVFQFAEQDIDQKVKEVLEEEFTSINIEHQFDNCRFGIAYVRVKPNDYGKVKLALQRMERRVTEATDSTVDKIVVSRKL